MKNLEITQEKILNTIRNLDNNWKNCPDNKIVALLSLAGLKRACNKGDLLSDRERLELEYLGFLNPKEIAKRLQFLGIEDKSRLSNVESIGEIWFESWAKLTSVYTERKEKIKSLQVKHDITALVKEELDFLGEKTHYLCQHFDLTLIPSDYPKLEAQKNKLISFFDRCSQKFSLQIFQSVEVVSPNGSDWLPVEIGSIKALSALYQWCDLCSYNYTVVDVVKRTEEKQLELQLSLGNGNIYEDNSFSYFFCLNEKNYLPKR